jgi:putative heme uptake system protein
MSTQPDGPRRIHVLVDGENIDATLGNSILGRRPRPEERPRWDRLLQFVADRYDGEPVGLFFLAVGSDLPMAFVQALLSIGYRPIPLSGPPSQKVVDIGIQRTLDALRDRDGDVVVVSNDGDFVDGVGALLDGSRRVAVVGFTEFRNRAFDELAQRGLECVDLELDVAAFTARLPRVRVIPIDEFDPLEFL